MQTVPVNPLRHRSANRRTAPWVFGIGLATVLGLAMSPVSAEDSPSSVSTEVAMKTNTDGAGLLLPRFAIDTNSATGTTTLFAVRNEGGQSVDIDIEYYRSNSPQAPQRTETITLAGKAVHTVNIRSVPNLPTDPDGFKRGFVRIVGPSTAELHGDYFLIDPANDFASGNRLLNTDPSSGHSDLCNLFTMRFLDGGGFDGGTVYDIFIDVDANPDGSDPVMDILAYDQAGNLLVAREYFADEVSFRVPADDLLGPSVSENFGALEFQFRNGAVGHVSGVMSALGRYSVGFEASCGAP